MKKYFLYDGSQQTGPFDIEELKSKKLNKDMPIWFEGLDDWTTIDKVDELKEIFTVIPPPFVVKLEPQARVQKPESQKTVSSDNPKQSSSSGRRLFINIGLVILGLIGYFIYTQIQHQQYQNDRESEINAEEDTKRMIRNDITSYVIADRSDYSYSEFGGISNLKISVTNNTDYLLDNVQVRVIYIKANGDVWDSKIIDFNLVNPHAKSTMKIGDTSRGTSVQYEIVSIKSSALGLN